MVLSVHKQPNGDLHIVTDELDVPENETDLEDRLCLLGYGLVRPEEIGALTSAPIFTDDPRQDDGSLHREGYDFWWFPDYALRSMVDDLRSRDGLTLTKAREYSATP